MLALAWTQLQDGTDTTLDGRLRDRPGARLAEPSWPRPSSTRAPSRTWPSPTGAGSDRHDQPGPGADPPRRRRPPAGAGLDRRATIGWARSRRPTLPRRLRPAVGPAGQRQQPAGRRRLSVPARPRDWEPPLRAERIEALLGAEPGARRRPVRRGPARHQSRRWRVDFLPYLLAAPAVRRGTARAAARHSPPGTGGCAPDRPEPLLFAAWYRELAAAIYADELGPLFPAYRGAALRLPAPRADARPGWCDDVATPPVETCRAAGGAGVRAGRWPGSSGRYGRDWRRWRWGEAHPAVLAHRPFEQSAALRDWFSLLVPVGGDGSTVNVAAPGTTREGIAVRRRPRRRLPGDLRSGRPRPLALDRRHRPVRPSAVAALRRSDHGVARWALSADDALAPEIIRRTRSARCAAPCNRLRDGSVQ